MTALWLSLGSAAAEPAASAMLYAARKMYRMAYRNVLNEQAERPDDPDLHTQAGVLLTRMGAASDGLASFELSRGAGSFYADMGGAGWHATALRETGRPLEAAALRRELLAVTPRKKALSLYGELILDYRAAARLDLAWDAALEGLSNFPGAPLLAASMADLCFEMGRFDEMDQWLAESDRGVREGHFRAHLVRGRVALADEDFATARRHGQVLRRRDLTDPDGMAFRFALEHAENGPAAALAVADSPVWRRVQAPQLACLEVLALLDLGHRTEARARVDALTARYPLRRDVQALQVILNAP